MSSELWNKVWQETPQEWDPLSEEIFQTLKKQTGGFSGKRILEAGCGSGRISLRMAAEGAQITLLDYSQKALDLCRAFFLKHSLSADYVKTDLLDPLPFEHDAFDIIWNAGVMEHFTPAEQRSILSRFAPLCRELHTFVPYSGSLFYRLGKWVAEQTGSWRYGSETPFASMKAVFEASGFVTEKEYCIAPIISLDFLAFFPEGVRFANLLKAFLSSPDCENPSALLDRAGGYLLYSKGVPAGSN